jgi:hypothetical protein
VLIGVVRPLSEDGVDLVGEFVSHPAQDAPDNRHPGPLGTQAVLGLEVVLMIAPGLAKRLPGYTCPTAGRRCGARRTLKQ